MSALSSQDALSRALADYRSGDYESALLTLAEAEVDEANYLDLAYILGLCHARLGRHDEALLYLEQVVTSGADDARVKQCRLALSYVYSVTGRSKLAEYELKKLLEGGDESVQVLASLGYASWAQGRLDEALSWYAKALDKAPDNLNALNGYGYILACKDGDLKKALACCRKAVEGSPGNPAYADSLGWTYLLLGMVDEAKRFLEYAAGKLPANDEVKRHMERLRKAEA
ncbi:MAG: tetratricopeptide repeat protein [Spirochaetia bacterium]|nr:tetratricopeptide repeat protein [Spirochaetia bacterium]